MQHLKKENQDILCQISIQMSHFKDKKYFQAPFVVFTIVVLPGTDPSLLIVTG